MPENYGQTPEQPVDLVSAGAVPQQPGPMSMSDVLAAMQPSGQLPPQAALAMQQRAAPNPFLAAASGMSAGGGKNPYLAQMAQGQQSNSSLLNVLSQMQHRQATEQQARATLLNTMRTQQEKRQDEKQKELLEVSKGLLTHDNETARKVGANVLADYLKANGRPVPEGLIDSLAQKRVSPDDINAILLNAARGMKREALIAMFPNVPVPILDETIANKDNRATLESLKLKTPEDIKAQQLAIATAEAELIFKRYGNMPPEMGAMIAAAHSKVIGRPFAEGTPETQQAAFDAGARAYLQQLQSKEAREAARLNIAQQAEQRQQGWDTLMRQFLGGVVGGGTLAQPGVLTGQPGGVPGAIPPIQGAPEAGAGAGPLAPAQAPVRRGVPGYEMGVNISQRPSISLTPRKDSMKALGELMKTDQAIENIDQISKKLITAETWPEAMMQGGRLKAGALTGGNELARVYRDNAEQILGVFARTLGLERGVLTEGDTGRARNGLPGYFDTKGIRDKKMKFMKSMQAVSTDVERAIYNGEDVEVVRQRNRPRALAILAQMEKDLGLPQRGVIVGGGPLGKADMVYNPATGQLEPANAR